jgi:hypothetical protein
MSVDPESMEDESGSRREPPLPESLVRRLDGLTPRELRRVVDYAQRRLRERHSSVSTEIAAGPGEEILTVDERSAYTEVVKREPCGEDCDGCPHGPYVYHVYEEVKPDGSASLHWVFLGRVFDPCDSER